MAEKEYIDRKAMLDYIDDCIPRMISKKGKHLIAMENVRNFIAKFEAADATPVKYARNLAAQFDETICTNCGVHLGEVLRIVREDNGDDAVYYYQPKYCANCGAKFDGDVSNVGNN